MVGLIGYVILLAIGVGLSAAGWGAAAEVFALVVIGSLILLCSWALRRNHRQGRSVRGGVLALAACAGCLIMTGALYAAGRLGLGLAVAALSILPAHLLRRAIETPEPASV
ncbi:hypothetical protein GCG21_04640 [Pseudactinotalea sp. HY160]|uniref:hypothetical protein n=1 Tax=Pseudactinotalea sp. HY160 TaxID=2654490 RepID=UPI00128C4705|nr:hypothetical protein [Pseudactinotalea sp. HY160]MPV49301.1 hypothetical protein [Pseudactinotalea sp. HY160]